MAQIDKSTEACDLSTVQCNLSMYFEDVFKPVKSSGQDDLSSVQDDLSSGQDDLSSVQDDLSSGQVIKTIIDGIVKNVENKELGIECRDKALEYEKNKNYKEMENNYLKAIELCQDVNSMINLGIYYETKQKNYEKAEEYYMMAINQYNDTDAMYNLADMFRIQKNYEKMEFYYKKTIEIANDASAIYWLAEYYMTIKDYEMMLKYLALSIANPDNTYYGKSLFLMAWYYDTIIGDREKAQLYYNMTIEHVQCPRAMYNMAVIYEEMSDYENMIRYYSMAAKERCMDSAKELAVYYHKICDYDNAMKYYVMMIEGSGKRLMDKLSSVNIIDLYNRLKLMSEPSQTILEFIQNLAKNNDSIITYHNKIALFTRLNHVTDCGICYDNKLNIDLKCGHCVCIDCYGHVYNSPCPFCRMK